MIDMTSTEKESRKIEKRKRKLVEKVRKRK